METLTYVLPECLASYLINGDDSGLDAEEKEQIDNFFVKEKNLGNCLSCSEEAYFSRSNDALGTLAGNVLEFTFEILNPEKL